MAPGQRSKTGASRRSGGPAAPAPSPPQPQTQPVAETAAPPPAPSEIAAKTLPKTHVFHNHPLPLLIAAFGAWKLYLLAIAFLAGSVGPAYDTSGALLANADLASSNRSTSNNSSNFVDHSSIYPSSINSNGDDSVVTRLTSWDAIYFVQNARRGYVYEQEWAFGAGLPLLVSGLHNVFVRVFEVDLSEGLLAVAVAHVSHLLSVLILYRLGRLVWPCDNHRNVGSGNDATDDGVPCDKENGGDRRDRDMAYSWIAACLHILSPAGLFLSAPNPESPFSCLSFAGYLAYATAVKSDKGPEPDKTTYAGGESPVKGKAVTDADSQHKDDSKRTSTESYVSDVGFSGDLWRLLAGILFGLATTFRSNGILNGVIFAYEAVLTVHHMLQQPTLPTLRRLVVIGLSGVCVAAGSIVPQAVAYLRFCQEPSGVPGEDMRPWCKQMLPSIYTFVQEHYWNVGLFRYWTLSNLPLFFLAAPMLFVLIRSSLDTLAEVKGNPLGLGTQEKTVARPGSSASVLGGADPRLVPLILCLASIQGLLAVLAITTYHIQIITRISSGYILWYWWLARSLAVGPRAALAGGIVIFMAMYASIQGVLFASFLPPA